MPETIVGYIYQQVDWLGGVNYLRNLLAAIKFLPEATIVPVLFAGRKANVDDFKGLARIVRTSILDRYHPLWWTSKFLGKVYPRRDYLLYWMLRKHRINVISHFGRLWQGCTIPAIGWIPDFQHLHLPSFFTAQECAERDAQFKEILQTSNAVIVSSQNGRDDLDSFCNNNATPVHILRFVSCLYPKLRESTSRVDLENRYNLDRSWFHIPNQFWAHKNHTIVLEALHSIKAQGQCPLVIATGSTNDYRNKEYFPSLMGKVKRYSLQDDFRALGVLPYTDVMALMRHAVAVINPSLFEGWSTTVEEAKALGKKIILSDIAVHREQNPSRGFYFDAHDSSELASLMISAMADYDEEKERSVVSETRKKQHLKRIEFVRNYENIILSVIRGKSHMQ